ncbi:MAG: hypothetical protein SGJ10_09380 [Bacteroidota bacterium]|nr:hypothetical protein [Bacteroidota bacterium]
MKVYLSVCLLFLSLHTFSQTANKDLASFKYKNSVQFELGGHGLVYSLNYERKLINRNKFKTTAQVGFSYYPAFTGIIKFWMPITINEIYSFSKKHHVEFGAGYTFTYEKFNKPNDDEKMSFLAFRLGYRYQFNEGKYTFRAAFTPLVELHTKPINSNALMLYKRVIYFHPLVGIAFGYNF